MSVDGVTEWVDFLTKDREIASLKFVTENWHNDNTCLRSVGNGTRIKLNWKKGKHIEVKIRCVVSFFGFFFQGNFILVPFPAHRQQVLSL